jgi:hypothetical protein
MVYSERYGLHHIGIADTAAAIFQRTHISVPWFATKNRLAEFFTMNRADASKSKR